jgi:hypothetical protein
VKRPPGWTRIPEPFILTVALTLYLLAIVWAAIRSPESFLAGLLSGSGSIAVGVWLGLVLSHRRGYTDEEPHLGITDDDDVGG